MSNRALTLCVSVTLASASACGDLTADLAGDGAATYARVTSALTGGRVPQVIDDYRSIPETPVVLPPAGGWFHDPDFPGTRILRVTDHRTRSGAECHHAYSTVPAFNASSTRLLIACGGEPLLYTFDPSADTLHAEGTLSAGQPFIADWENAFWSGSDPNILYALGRPTGAARTTTLYRIDVTRTGAGRFTAMRDFAGAWPYTNWELRQMRVSDDDQVFTLLARTTDDRYYRLGAYLRGKNQFVNFARAAFDVDECAVDKLGRYVHVFGTADDDHRVAVWDPYQNLIVRMLEKGPLHRTGGHYDLGATVLVNGDLYEYGVVARANSDSGILAPKNVFRYRGVNGVGYTYTNAHHLSLRNRDERFFVLSTYSLKDPSWPPFQDEIVVVKSDGSGFSRVAHTRALQPITARGYWHQPRAVVDPSGRFIVFDSNHGTSRTDVFIAILP